MGDLKRHEKSLQQINWPEYRFASHYGSQSCNKKVDGLLTVSSSHFLFSQTVSPEVQKKLFYTVFLLPRESGAIVRGSLLQKKWVCLHWWYQYVWNSHSAGFISCLCLYLLFNSVEPVKLLPSFKWICDKTEQNVGVLDSRANSCLGCRHIKQPFFRVHRPVACLSSLPSATQTHMCQHHKSRRATNKGRIWINKVSLSIYYQSRRVCLPWK